MPNYPKNNPESVNKFMNAVMKMDLESVGELLDVEPTLIHAHDHRCFAATALIHAANRQDYSMIDLLLDRGIDIDAKSDWWAGPFGVLHCCNREVAVCLVKKGATVDAHAASRHGWLDRLTSIVKSDSAVVHEAGGDGQRPLHFAATVEIAALLLSLGAEIDARDVDHESTAAQHRLFQNNDVVQFLMDQGAASDVFMILGLDDPYQLKRWLNDHPESIRHRVGSQPFVTHKSDALMIYGYTIGMNSTAMHAVCKTGNCECVDILVDAGADINARGGYDNCLAIHLAAWNGQSELIEKFAQRGSELTRRSGHIHNNTPLGWAVVNGQLAAAEKLIDLGAPIDANDFEECRRGARGEFLSFSKADVAIYPEILAMLTRKQNLT